MYNTLDSDTTTGIEKNAPGVQKGVQRELRLILTEKCNYKCGFCHKEGLQGGEKTLLSSDDYRFLFHTVKSNLGIKNVTLTGGEPLLSKDITAIAKGIKEEGGGITVVSNGSLLNKKIELGAFVDRFNISLHSLDTHRYSEMVGRKNSLVDVIKGIQKIKEVFPQVEIRLNTTFVKGINTSEEEIIKYLDFAEKMQASIKYVELYPDHGEGFVELSHLDELFTKMGFTRRERGRKIEFMNGPLKIILTRMVCADAEKEEDPGAFCQKNSDIFMTPDGRFQTCRPHPEYINLLPSIKKRDSEVCTQQVLKTLEMMGKNCIHKKDVRNS